MVISVHKPYLAREGGGGGGGEREKEEERGKKVSTLNSNICNLQEKANELLSFF